MFFVVSAVPLVGLGDPGRGSDKFVLHLQLAAWELRPICQSNLSDFIVAIDDWSEVVAIGRV